MTLVHYILILIVPVIGLFIRQVFPDLSSNVLKRISLGLGAWNLIALISPVSFAGETFDFAVFLLFLLSYSSFLYKRNGVVYKMLFKQLGVVIVLFSCLILEIIIAMFNTLPDISSYLAIEKVTKDRDYRLVHRKVNKNFVYSGDHLIYIKKRIKYCPVFEYHVGTVNAGEHFDIAFPSQMEYKVDGEHRKLLVKSGEWETFSY